tara:strand:+ start:366 stop:1289 length:924 start_codon:yes stop_codon:yes gene_type:complete
MSKVCHINNVKDSVKIIDISSTDESDDSSVDNCLICLNTSEYTSELVKICPRDSKPCICFYHPECAKNLTKCPTCNEKILKLDNNQSIHNDNQRVITHNLNIIINSHEYSSCLSYIFFLVLCVACSGFSCYLFCGFYMAFILEIGHGFIPPNLNLDNDKVYFNKSKTFSMLKDDYSYITQEEWDEVVNYIHNTNDEIYVLLGTEHPYSKMVTIPIFYEDSKSNDFYMKWGTCEVGKNGYGKYGINYCSDYAPKIMSIHPNDTIHTYNPLTGKYALQAFMGFAIIIIILVFIGILKGCYEDYCIQNLH